MSEIQPLNNTGYTVTLTPGTGVRLTYALLWTAEQLALADFMLLTIPVDPVDPAVQRTVYLSYGDPGTSPIPTIPVPSADPNNAVPATPGLLGPKQYNITIDAANEIHLLVDSDVPNAIDVEIGLINESDNLLRNLLGRR